MYKHQKTIDKLTIEQKLSLIADVSALGGVARVGKSGVKMETMEEVNVGDGKKSMYPSFHALANTWNKELFQDVAVSLTERAKANGVNLLELPHANLKSSPYSDGLSEDPYLVSEIIHACVKAGQDVKVKTCLPDPSIRKVDVEVSDIEPDERAINEYFLRPFERAVKDGLSTVKIGKSALPEDYAQTNKNSLLKYKKKLSVIHTGCTAIETLQMMRNGGQLCQSDALGLLKEGYERYQKLQKQFENGEISLNEMEAECQNGTAISPEMVDVAVDKVLDFTIDCAKIHSQSKALGIYRRTDKLDLRAAEESIVLLKNQKKVLPLKHKYKIALIGGPSTIAENGEKSFYAHATELFRSHHKIKYVGCAKGYDLENDRNDELMNEALTLAKRADVAVVFLGCDERGRGRAQRNKTATLPATQLALLERLSKLKIKVVGVVCGENYPDMSFDKNCHALLLAPIGGSKTAEALFRILRGKALPSGRLSTTCYEDTDKYFENLYNYKEYKRNKVGVFYGYRHYDTSALSVRYPFGFGLTYTKFKYGKVKLTKTGFHIKVKNLGKRTAQEVVQVYVGKKKSGTVRPKKELKAFEKITLKPRQKKKLTFTWKDMDLRVWDKTRKKWVNEKGMYEFYVGSSCKDIRRKGKFYAGTEGIAKNSDNKLSSYIQTCSNVRSCGYYLEPPIRIPLKQERKRKRAIGLSIMWLCLDIIYAYFYYTGWVPKDPLIGRTILILLAFFNLNPMIKAIVRTVRKKKRIKKGLEENMKMKQKQREELNVEDLAEELPYELLFEEEFSKKPYEVQEEEKVETKQEREERVREIVPFDKEFNLSVVCKEFSTYAFERGISLGHNGARKIFSALSSTRLVLLKSNDDEMLKKLLVLIGEYFGSNTAINNCANAAEGDTLLFCNGAISAIAKRIMNTSNEDTRIQIAAMEEVKTEQLKPSLTPIIRYLDQPERAASIAIQSATGGKSYEIPDAIWFIVALASGERITTIPKYILDLATVVDLMLQPGYSKTRPVVQEISVEDAPAPIAETVVEESVVAVEEAKAEESASSVETEANEPIVPVGEVKSEENAEAVQQETTTEEVEAKAEETPAVEDTKAEETPTVEETKAEETPAVEETKAEEIPIVEETKAEETPAAEDTKAEEAPAVEETKAEEIPAVETPKAEIAMQVVETFVEKEKTPVKQLIYPQFRKLIENAHREYQLEEVLWKRVDKMEEYVNGYNDYRIENKKWQRMEKYVAAYLAAGGEPEEALDAAMSGHLIYGMLPCLATAKKPLEEKLSNTLETVFGEGNVEETLKAVKEEGLGV